MSVLRNALVGLAVAAAGEAAAGDGFDFPIRSPDIGFSFSSRDIFPARPARPEAPAPTVDIRAVVVLLAERGYTDIELLDASSEKFAVLAVNDRGADRILLVDVVTGELLEVRPLEP